MPPTMELIGVIHLLPLPGSPRERPMAEVLAAAEADARAWLDGGADALLVENFGDVPFFKDAVPPVTVAAMTRAASRVAALAGGRALGINVLRNDALAALSVAHVCDARFVRVNVLVGAAVTDQGVVEGCAAELSRLRAALGAPVEIWADVAVKHARPLAPGADPLREARDAVDRGGADALIVTGDATGSPADLELAGRLRRALPATRLIVGSGVTPAQAPHVAAVADGVIVGTWVKRDGRSGERVDAARVATLRRALDDGGG